MTVDHSELETRCTAMLRDVVRAKWEQSGRDFGRAEPPPPTVRIDRANQGELHARLEEVEELTWQFPWDGNDTTLHGWIEILAEDYWSDCVDPATSTGDRRSNHLSARELPIGTRRDGA